jgi:hypothetical protein
VVRSDILAAVVIFASTTATSSVATAAPDPAVAPRWLRIPSEAEISGSFPDNALRQGVGGEAMLKCFVAYDGALDKCVVIEDSPAGWGFGDAALGLAPTFIMTKGLQDVDGHRPVVTIPLRWRAGTPWPRLGGDELGHLLHTRWLTAPTFADVVAAYPRQAHGVDGYVALSCALYRQDGQITRCRTTIEEPTGLGFAEAAMSLKSKFHALVPEKPRKEAMAVWTELRVRFPAPSASESANRILQNPLWMTDLDPTDTAKAYPAEALAGGARFGVGVAECDVVDDRRLAHCLALPGRPPNLGFSEAAAKIVTGVQLSAWTEEGTPVDGAKARILIPFHPPDAADIASAPPAGR